MHFNMKIVKEQEAGAFFVIFDEWLDNE